MRILLRVNVYGSWDYSTILSLKDLCRRIPNCLSRRFRRFSDPGYREVCWNDPGLGFPYNSLLLDGQYDIHSLQATQHLNHLLAYFQSPCALPVITRMSTVYRLTTSRAKPSCSACFRSPIHRLLVSHCSSYDRLPWYRQSVPRPHGGTIIHPFGAAKL